MRRALGRSGLAPCHPRCQWAACSMGRLRTSCLRSLSICAIVPSFQLSRKGRTRAALDTPPGKRDGRAARGAEHSGEYAIALAFMAMATGLLFVSVGNVMARDGVWWADGLFWIGLLLLIAPTSYLLLARTNSERMPWQW